MPLSIAAQALRLSAEGLLHHAYGSDSEAQLYISAMLGLQLNGMHLRSGFRTNRCDNTSSAPTTEGARWLIWEEVGRPSSKRNTIDGAPPALGALVLRRQGSGIVMEYIVSRYSCGGRGWPMVLAAEEICRREGMAVLYSAADLSQDGSRADPHDRNGKKGPSAAEAHRRWGFEEIQMKEWEQVGLSLYDSSRCDVIYMKKRLMNT